MEIKKLEVDELNLPENPGQAPQIIWGEDFDNFDDTHKIIYLKKLCSALNHATDLIQKERNNLLEEANKLLTDLENANQAVEIRKQTLVKAITDHNAEKQKLIERIQFLEREVKIRDEILKSYGHNLEG